MADYDSTDDILNDPLMKDADMGDEPNRMLEGDSEPKNEVDVDENGDNVQPEVINPNQPAPGQTQEEFDAQKWELNYKGQKHYPRDRQHLVDMAQKGISYERSMEQLNEERRMLQEQQTSLSQLSELDKRMKENPDFANYLLKQVQQYTQNPNIQQDDDQEDYVQDPRLNEVQQKLSDIEQWKQQQVQEKADRQLDETIQKLRDKYPDQPWDTDEDGNGTLTHRLLKHAYDNGLTNLETAYRDYTYDHVAVNSKALTLKQEKERRQAEHKAGVVNTNISKPAPKVTDNGYQAGDSYDDVYRKALREFQ